jgi:hypothetical protein
MPSALEGIPQVATASTRVSLPHTTLVVFLPGTSRCHHFALEGRRAVGVALDLLVLRFARVVRWGLACGARPGAGDGDSAGTGCGSARFCIVASAGV